MKGFNQNGVVLGERQPFIDISNARFEPVTLDSTTVDSANTPTTQLRRGLVVGYDGAGGNYVDAGDSLVDAHEVGTIDSAEAPDGDWEGTTLTVNVEGEGEIAYTLGSLTTITNLASAIADVNNGPLGGLVFAANDGSGNLRLTAIKPGRRLVVTSSLATAYAAAANAANADDADLTKHGILLDPIPSMLGLDDTAEDRNATIITANAVVRESELLELTQEAREWFADNNIQLV